MSDGSAATGGGLQNDGGTLVLNSVTITGNSASGDSGGGGVYAKGGSTTLGNCTITGNTANNQGGGIYTYGDTLSLTSVMISSNTVTGPRSHGGGLYTVQGSATLHGCTISEKHSRLLGGGRALQISRARSRSQAARSPATPREEWGRTEQPIRHSQPDERHCEPGNQSTSYKGSGLRRWSVQRLVRSGHARKLHGQR